MLPPADDNNAAMLLFALAVGLMIVTLLMRLSRYTKRRRREETREERGGSYSPEHPAVPPPELDQWEVRLQERARELIGQLDSKMSALQALTAEADRAARRLEDALAESGRSETCPAEPPPAETSRASAESRRDEIAMLANYGYDAHEIARRVGAPISEVERILRLREFS